MNVQPESTLADTLLSPPVLITFLLTLILVAALAGLVLWLVLARQRRQREKALAGQRLQQEGTIERLLDSVAQDKEGIIAGYEGKLRERDARIAVLEGEVARLRDRISGSGLLGLFGGKQRDVVGALLLENEQLHELLTTKQEQLRDLMADMTGKLMDRLDEQARESARAVRYKQALLSAFLQREDTQRMLGAMAAEGTLASPPMENEDAGKPSKPEGQSPS
ncbi:MAG: hypothetical protein ACYC5M_02125 [Anaerolineae bacterium]